MGGGAQISIQEAVQVAGYLLGTVLHGVLLVLFWRRRRRRAGESLFAGFVCALGLWNLGQFLEVFVTLLRRGAVPQAWLVSCDLLAYLGLLLLPSTLLHSLLALLAAREPAIARTRSRRLAVDLGMVLLYFPIVFLPRVVSLTLAQPGEPGFVQLSPLISLYLGWFDLSFCACALLCVLLARRARGGRERAFYVVLVVILFVTAGVFTAVSAFHVDSLASGGLTLESVIILLSTLPSAMFGYIVHRYDDVEFILRRSIFTLVLVAATALAYLWGVSRLSAFLAERFALEPELLKGAFTLALVALYHPFRRGLERTFNSVVYKQSFVYQQVLSELVTYLGQGTAIPIRNLALHVTDSVNAALDLESSEVVLVAPSGAATFATPQRRPPPVVTACLELLERRPWRYFREADLGRADLDLRALQEMLELDAEAIVPVRHEGRVIALISIGPKRDRRPLFAEEVDLLLALAEHLAIALTGLALYEEKERLLRLLHETERRLALGRFSSSVAHRVKNPLSSIKAITQSIALDMESEDDRREDLLMVVSEVDRLTSIVDQLLDYAEAERREDSRGCRLAEVAAEVAALFQHEADLFGVRILVEVAEALIVPGSRADWREVLSNLIQNGIHAMPAGGELRVWGGTLDEAALPPELAEEVAIDRGTRRLEGELWAVEVRDDGAGFRPEEEARLFEPFFTTKPEGTGLGLAITRRRVRELGGLIGARNRPPPARGASFLLILPRATSEEERDVGVVSSPRNPHNGSRTSTSGSPV